MHFYPYHMVFFWVFIPRTRFWSAFILVVYALKIVFLGPLLIFGCLYFLILLICFQGWSSILFKRYHLSQPSNRRWSPVQKTHSFPIPNGQPRSFPIPRVGEGMGDICLSPCIRAWNSYVHILHWSHACICRNSRI